MTNVADGLYLRGAVRTSLHRWKELTHARVRVACGEWFQILVAPRPEPEARHHDHVVIVCAGPVDTLSRGHGHLRKEERAFGMVPALCGLFVPGLQHQHGFSPTDTPALARWAKATMMLQSLISLTCSRCWRLGGQSPLTGSVLRARLRAWHGAKAVRWHAHTRHRRRSDSRSPSVRSVRLRRGRRRRSAAHVRPPGMGMVSRPEMLTGQALERIHLVDGAGECEPSRMGCPRKGHVRSVRAASRP